MIVNFLLSLYIFSLQQIIAEGRLSAGQQNVTKWWRNLRSDTTDEGEEPRIVNVIVGYKSRNKIPITVTAACEKKNSLRSYYKRTAAVAVSVPADELDAIDNDEDVLYVEEDLRVFPHSETVPWGIQAIQASQPYSAKTIPLPQSNNKDVGCRIKVCVVDSGLFVDHPDIPYSLDSPTLQGKEFGLPPDQSWYEPRGSHGTHVTGTILAAGGNDVGVVGVIPDSQGICLMIARVFPDNQNQGQLSHYIDEGIEWCADNGANIINQSLGGQAATTASHELHKALERQGILVVSSAGNGGSSDYSYPASFERVLSVAAVDSNHRRAPFSQTNNRVDISAPGVDILSTSVGVGIFDDRDTEYTANPFEYSEIPSKVISGGITDCGLGIDRCERALGKICLIERGATLFVDKVKNCEAGGGTGVIIYNNRHSGFSGTLRPGAAKIPAISVSRQIGLVLLNRSSVKIDFSRPSYDSTHGTSMAAPHVTGAAAKIWAARPACNHAQVRRALKRTTKNLGNSHEYGRGLVQAVDAYNYLLNLAPPCGLSQPAQQPAPKPPVKSPAKPPVNSPVQQPVKPPVEPSVDAQPAQKIKYPIEIKCPSASAAEGTATFDTRTRRLCIDLTYKNWPGIESVTIGGPGNDSVRTLPTSPLSNECRSFSIADGKKIQDGLLSVIIKSSNCEAKGQISNDGLRPKVKPPQTKPPTKNYNIKLNSAQIGSACGSSRTYGEGTATYDTRTRRLCVHLSYQNLPEGTIVSIGGPTSDNIRTLPAGPITNECRSFGISDGQLLEQHKLYIIVKSNNCPNGLIKGNLFGDQ